VSDALHCRHPPLDLDFPLTQPIDASQPTEIATSSKEHTYDVSDALHIPGMKFATVRLAESTMSLCAGKGCAAVATGVCGECRSIVCEDCVIECQGDSDDGSNESCFTTLCLSPGCADASWVTYCDHCRTSLAIPKCPCGDDSPRYCSAACRQAV